MSSTITDALASGLQLLSPYSETRQLRYTAGGDLSAGDVIVHNDVVGVIAKDIVSGAIAVLIYKAPKMIFPVAAQPTARMMAGEKVYWDASGGVLTETASSHKWVGVVLEDTSIGDTTVLIELDGTLSIVS